MKNYKIRNVIPALIFLLMLMPVSVFPQQDKDAASTVKVQGEVAADSDSYIIGPEDILNIYVWREESLTKTVPVRMDGKISLPLVDDVQASGLTPLQLKEILVTKLKNFIDNPNVSVTVIEANSFKVYVSGQVRNPGVLKLRSETSFLQLMTMTGGFTDWADQKNILIIRKEKGEDKRITVNYKKIIEGKESDIAIKRGDTVIIP
ncbi:MAG: polysaccharide export protein [Proteobacteria bacterium]|nr:polysaccharide export protein [Pseudomonadota bacterium]